MTDALNNEGAQRRPNRVAEEKAQRRRRADTSETRNMKLAVPKELLDPRFVYRFVNDTPGRIHDKTVNDDWDIVEGFGSTEKVSTRRHAGSGPNGQSLEAVLIRKPKEFYEEDKAAEQERISERERAIEEGIHESPEALSGPAAYVPGGAKANRIGR